MKVENLCVGQIIKNYKVMCELLGQETKTSNSKKSQIKEWERYFKFHKDGQKIIIDEVYSEEQPSTDKRKLGNNIKDYKGFNIELEYKNNTGIYKIVLDNKIYIGSTIAGFRKRFTQHCKGTEELMRHTYDLLQQGGRFEILHDMTGIEDETLIRMVESEYIKYYLLNPKWDVINKKDSSLTFTKYYKIKNKSIKISEDKYYEAIQLLAKNGLIDREGFEL